jgi:hypothetical protein
MFGLAGFGKTLGKSEIGFFLLEKEAKGMLVSVIERKDNNVCSVALTSKWRLKRRA